MELERLAYETALRALERQERLLDELRARTGVLLAASALATSFVGRDAFQDPAPVPAVIALIAFITSIAASVLILVPRDDQFASSLSGPALYERHYERRSDLGEVYRRLSYDLLVLRSFNDNRLRALSTLYRVAAAALIIEIVVLVALVSDSIL